MPSKKRLSKRCRKDSSLNTKGKYSKVRDTEIKWSIINKSIMIIIFLELIDYSTNCASLSIFYSDSVQRQWKAWSDCVEFDYLVYEFVLKVGFLWRVNTGMDYTIRGSSSVKIIWSPFLLKRKEFAPLGTGSHKSCRPCKICSNFTKYFKAT